MTATNHVLTGAVVVAALPHNPLIALLIAFIAHFALDAIPHDGDRANETHALERLKFILPIDAGIAGSILLVIFFLKPEHYLLIMSGALLCASPDLLQIPRYIRFLKTDNPRPDKNWFSTFHSRIQWGERPWGMFVEVPFAVAMTIVLAKLLKF